MTSDTIPQPTVAACPVFDVSLLYSWRELRRVRLQALQESPHAFVLDATAATALEDGHWKQCMKTSTWVVARNHRMIVGIASSIVAPECPDARYIESVWVDPPHRGKGVLTRMVEQLEVQAWAEGATRLMLWVLDTNGSARVAYERLEFEIDNDQDPLETKKGEGDTYVKERRMYRNIAPLSLSPSIEHL